MEFAELVMRRRTVRRFENAPVDRTVNSAASQPGTVRAIRATNRSRAVPNSSRSTSR